MSALKKTIPEQFHEAANDASYGRVIKGIAAAALVTASQLSHAAAMAVPPELTDALASVAVIGAAVFAIAVGVKLYKWIKGAL